MVEITIMEDIKAVEDIMVDITITAATAIIMVVLPVVLVAMVVLEVMEVFLASLATILLLLARSPVGKCAASCISSPNHYYHCTNK